MYSPACPWTGWIDEAGLDFTEILLPLPHVWVQRLELDANMINWIFNSNNCIAVKNYNCYSRGENSILFCYKKHKHHLEDWKKMSPKGCETLEDIALLEEVCHCKAGLWGLFCETNLSFTVSFLLPACITSYLPVCQHFSCCDDNRSLKL